MTGRPITMPACQVRLLLDGVKTQTRRIIRSERAHEAIQAHGPEALTHDRFRDRLPIGAGPGERLWVRETWQIHGWATDCVTVRYKAQSRLVGFTEQIEQIPHPGRNKSAFSYVAPMGPDYWRPSIHMPWWASRLTLEVAAVKVERLQDITEDNAIGEGGRPFFDQDNAEIVPGPNGAEHRMAPLRGPRDDFARNWEQMHGRGAWRKNPWVQAISFRVTRKTDEIERAA